MIKQTSLEIDMAISVDLFAQEVHNNAVEHGWWEEERGTPECLMLMVSELSEALEEYRDGKPDFYIVRETGSFPQYESFLKQITDPQDWKQAEKPEGVGVELADCIIRILDFCAARDIPIGSLVAIKHEYNKTRPYRHGGKKS